jgi:hypothetical protein
MKDNTADEPNDWRSVTKMKASEKEWIDENQNSGRKERRSSSKSWRNEKINKERHWGKVLTSIVYHQDKILPRHCIGQEIITAQKRGIHSVDGGVLTQSDKFIGRWGTTTTRKRKNKEEARNKPLS